MAGKTLGERVERLEVVYCSTQEMFKEIRDHLATQNGDIGKLNEFKVRHDAREEGEQSAVANLRWWVGTAIAVNVAVMAVLQLVLR